MVTGRRKPSPKRRQVEGRAPSRRRPSGARARPALARILVGLDGSSWSRAAVEQAVAIAHRTQAALTGVAIIDHREIDEAVGPEPMGAAYYAQRREEQLLREARQHVAGLAAEFRACCERARVPHFESVEEGVPFQRLVQDSLVHDLVVLGLRTYFHYPPSDKPGTTLEKVLRHGTRPVLAVREDSRPIRRVGVALDGSAQAARTLQLFALLCPWDLETLRLIHAGDDRPKALALLEPGAAFLEAHGLHGEPVLLKGSPVNVIPEYVSSQDLDLLVMGAYGKALVSKFLFGSLTATLLAQPRASLFLAH